MINFSTFWRRLAALINQYEKVLLALLSVVIVISGTFWYHQFARTQTDQPTAGGSYVEGLVGDRDDVETIAAKITKAGLFTLAPDGRLQNLLVEKWEANSDFTEYRFTLLDGIDGGEIRDSLEQNSAIIDQAAVSLDGRQLTLTLPSGNPNLPLILTKPFFDYGPYKVSKITNKTTILIRNTRPHAVTPYLNKIIIHTFADEEALKKAITKREVDGGVIGDTAFAPAGFSVQTMDLPLYYAAVFNVNVAPFREATFRQQVINATSGSSKAFKLTTANTEPYLSLATTLASQWQAVGFQVTLDPRPLDEIQQKVAPSRDFQVLLTGISYGNELDPYYLWHSSQIRPPGNNLAGIKSDKIDNLIAAIRSNQDATERAALVSDLHQALKDEGAGLIVKQEAARFLIADTVRYVSPLLPISVDDRWQSVAMWWAR